MRSRSSKRTVSNELEKDTENEVVSWAYTSLGITGSKLKIVGDDGYPDRLFWIPGGRPLLIEFKRPGEEPRPKQVYVHNMLRKLGYLVEVCDNVEDGKSIIRSCLVKLGYSLPKGA